MTNENGESSVEAGIREWRKTKADAEAAIEKAHVAEQDATFVRGQLEVLQQQKKSDDALIRSLQAHAQEMELLVDTLGGAVLSILEKRKAGTFRRPGSIQNGGERLAAVRSASGSEGEPPDQDDRPAEQRPARSGQPSGLDLGQFERDIANVPLLSLRGEKRE